MTVSPSSDSLPGGKAPSGLSGCSLFITSLATICLGLLGWCTLEQRRETNQLLADVRTLSERLGAIEGQLRSVSALWQQSHAAAGAVSAPPVHEETLLQPKTVAVPAPTLAPDPHPASGAAHGEARPEKAGRGSAQRREYRVNARISAIEKFVPLSAEQRERLRAKFAAEIDQEDDPTITVDENPGAASGAEQPQAAERAEPVPPETETLEAIVGDESARYYRDQMKQAFDRAQQEEQEKDVLLLARKLSLTPEQEGQLRDVVRGVEAQVREELKAQNPTTSRARGGQSMQQRMQALLAENSLRKKILDERVKPVLTAEQYQMYLEQQAESASSDLEVWHSPE